MRLFLFLAHLFVQPRSLPLVTELKNSVPLIARLLLVLLIHTLATLLGKSSFYFLIYFVLCQFSFNVLVCLHFCKVLVGSICMWLIGLSIACFVDVI